MSADLLHRLAELADRARQRDTLTLGDVADAHEDAAHGAMLVMLAVPCVLPLPGAGTVLSLGLITLALLMWQRHTTPCLPDPVARLRLSAPAAQRLVGVLTWCYRWAERLAGERWVALTAPRHQRWVAVVVACMAGLIFLPIPFGNLLPAAALVLLGVGLMFRDGVAVSLALGTASLALFGTGALLAWTWQWGGQWL